MSSGNSNVHEAPEWLQQQEAGLASFAMRTTQSRGREHPEEPHAFRTLYPRDRDRIVHCTAFRRLMYKTQVLVVATNDHHRTRLTHTFEVAMISRTIARRLNLNEDLTEAIALSHDLGHPPFGHAGEAALRECMKEHGGFEHNQHGLRIVEFLEYRYADFPGLNLSWEVREAMAHHSKAKDAPELKQYLNLGQPLLEAQVVDAADSLAYDTHDIDDALSCNVVSFSDLEEVAFWREARQQCEKKHGSLRPEQLQPTVVRTLINWQVRDLLDNLQKQLQEHNVKTVEDVRNAPDILAFPGDEVRQLKAELEEFLHRRVYQHHRVQRMANKGRRFVHELFEEFRQCPSLLPERYSSKIPARGLERTVCDYVAGMTDRFAQDEHQRLFQPFAST